MADTELIKDKLDIAQFIAEYVPLKKAGIYFKACCPFHKEKTPSFMVNTERRSWHCFGCGKGGDVFSFLQEMEGMDFPEALKILADRAGVKLDNNFKSEVNKSQKNRLLEINAKAAYFFHRFLLDMSASAGARQYLENRGLKKETIEQWQIGFIPDQWELLTQYLIKKGVGIDDLVASGLTIHKEGAPAGRGYYDRFRGRIMFPICNTHGDVVGFTGRILVETENSGGKYVNTPETPVYHKSEVIYGLDKAKTEIKSKDLVVLVEGQMDVIACHQAGMKNVVAASGTALTIEQTHLLKRYSPNIAMAFDADSAGINAAKRGIEVAIKEGLNVRVIQIPDGAGKDADECLKKNPTVWFEAVKNSREIMEWLFALALKNKNLSSPKDKQTVANELLPNIGLIPYAVEREHWLKQLAEKLGVESSVLKEELKRFKLQTTKSVNQKSGPDNAPKINLPPPIGAHRLERLLLLLIKFPTLTSGREGLLNTIVTVGPAGVLYDWLKMNYNSSTLLDAKRWLKECLGEEADIWQMRAAMEFEDWEAQTAGIEADLLLSEIKKDQIQRRRLELRDLIASAQSAGDRAKSDELLAELQNLT